MKRKRSIAGRMLTGMGTIIGSTLVRNAAQKVFDECKGKMVYTLQLNIGIDIICEFIQDHFKDIPDQIATYTSIKDDEIRIDIDNICNGWHGITENFSGYTLIEGIPVKLLTMYTKNHDEDASCCGTYRLQTLKIGDYPDRIKRYMKDYIRRKKKEMKEKEEKNILMFTPGNNSYIGDRNRARYITNFNRRNFNNVFVTEDIKNQITTSLDNFRDSVDWYMQHGIPYHFGILLHGEPGTGKTSIAQAIAEYMHANLIIVPGDMLLDLPRIFKDNIENHFELTRKEFNVVVIEDIDCGIRPSVLMRNGIPSEEISSRVKTMSRARKSAGMGKCSLEEWDSFKDAFDDNLGLASVLNTIDGIGAPTNTIFIFTTNHIEKLDPALIRPGRIDLKLEIEPVCVETFNQFMKVHYGEDVKIPTNLKIKDGISFAELQNLVMCKKTAEEVISFVRNPDEFIKKHSKENK